MGARALVGRDEAGFALARETPVGPRKQKKPAKLKVYLAREGEWPDVLAGVGWPVVSERLKDALQAETSSWPVQLHGVDKKPIASPVYYALNPKRGLNIVDWKDGDFEWSGAKHNSAIVKYERLVLHGDNQDGEVFGAYNIYGVIFVSEAGQERLRAAGYTGLDFVDSADLSRA
jgi:hypothetical protein